MRSGGRLYRGQGIVMWWKVVVWGGPRVMFLESGVFVRHVNAGGGEVVLRALWVCQVVRPVSMLPGLEISRRGCCCPVCCQLRHFLFS